MKKPTQWTVVYVRSEHSGFYRRQPGACRLNDETTAPEFLATLFQHVSVSRQHPPRMS